MRTQPNEITEQPSFIIAALETLKRVRGQCLLGLRTLIGRIALSVCFLPFAVLCADSTQYDYLVTTNTYEPLADWRLAVKQEFGPTAEVVDWNTLKADFGGSVSAIRGLFDQLGILAYPVGDAPAVTWNGSQVWSGTRSYGVNRLEGYVPGGYLVHDQIQNNWVCLGSWPDKRRVIARVPTSPSTTNTLSIRVSQVELCWDTLPNNWYQLQYRSTLTTNVWMPLHGGWVSGTGGRYCTNDTVLAGQPQRFYRFTVTDEPPQ